MLRRLGFDKGRHFFVQPCQTHYLFFLRIVWVKTRRKQNGNTYIIGFNIKILILILKDLIQGDSN